MKKWAFWATMCALSILNGGCFFGGSASAMNRGLEDVDNQAALLFIPLLWIIAGMVLLAMNLSTLARGMRMERNQRIDLSELFQRAGLSPRAKAHRTVFLIMTSLLMLLGFLLFAEEIMWAALYALSGGALLLTLYVWRRAPVRRG